MENLSPQAIQYIAREIRDMSLKPLSGVEVLASSGSEFAEPSQELNFIMEGPEETPYYGHRFKLKIRFHSDFPHTPPKAYFMTKIFHPNINVSTGEVCVNVLKKDWKKDLGLKHVILTIKCLLIVPYPESALNEEAARLIFEDYEGFKKKAALIAKIHALKKLSCSDNEDDAKKKGTEGAGSEKEAISSSNSSNTTNTTARGRNPARGKRKALRRL